MNNQNNDMDLQQENNNKTIEDKSFVCPKCNSSYISIQIVNKVYLVKKHHSFLWWITIGWIWTAFKWIWFTVPALIFKIFGIGKKYKTKNVEKKVAVCQSCGNSWNI